MISTAYTTSEVICAMFVLYTLHKFSTLPATRLDPVTNQQVPLLSQIQNTAALEATCHGLALSDKTREQIKKLIDLDQTKELFEASEVSTSIAASFVLPVLG